VRLSEDDSQRFLWTNTMTRLPYVHKHVASHAIYEG